MLPGHPRHPALRRGRRAGRGGAHPAPGAGAARRAVGATALPGQLHLRRAPGVLRRLPAHPGRARAAPAAVRGGVPGQRDHRRRHLGLRRPRPASPAWPRPATTRVCVGGVGFFNRRSPLGRGAARPVRRGHWAPEFGVTSPTCFDAQVDRLAERAAALPAERPLFLFVNVAALHQPNRFYLPGADGRTAGTPTPPRWSTSTGTSAGCSPLRHRAGPAAASRSSAPTTAPPTARTATPATASATTSCGPSPTPSSSCDRGNGDQHRHGPRRLAVPALPLRVPAQDRLPAAAAPAAAAPSSGRAEPRDALFLYVHLPFCEMRCGFCNLFTRANAPAGAGRRPTCGQLRRQAERVARRARRRRRVRPGGVRRRHADLSDRRRADGCSTSSRAPRAPAAGRTAVGGDLAGHRDRRPAGVLAAHGVHPGQHRRAELRRRRGARRRPPAAARRGGGRARRDPRRRRPGAQHRPDLRHRRADRGDLAGLAWTRRWPGGPRSCTSTRSTSAR